MAHDSAPSALTAGLWITAAALVLLGGPMALFLLGRIEYSLDSDEAVAEAITGTWAWEDRSCEEDPQSISFSDDLAEMYIAIPRRAAEAEDVQDAITTYRVIHFMPNGVRGAIHGETRLTDDGEPVVWDLVLQSDDNFVWHRTDWAPRSFTRRLMRCR